MVELKGSRITSLLPSTLSSLPEVRAIAYAVSRQVDKMLACADGAQLLCSVDNMPHEVLDYLALEKRTPSYSENYSLEVKRKLIKDTLLTYLQMGTPASVNRTIETIYGAGAIEEWFEYEGEPHYFRLYIDITDSAEKPMIGYDAAAVTETISETKRVSSWLETLSYSITHGITIGSKVEAVKYAVPICGTLRCGTWWMASTLGYSTQGALNIGAGVDAWATEHNYCGTLPDIATLGYSSGSSIEAGATVGGYAADVAEAGDGTLSGTRPLTATTGYSGMATVSGAASVRGYTASPAFCGVVRCGTDE